MVVGPSGQCMLHILVKNYEKYHRTCITRLIHQNVIRRGVPVEIHIPIEDVSSSVQHWELIHHSH